MVELLQFGQDAVKQFEFSRCTIEVRARDDAAWYGHVLAIGLFDVLEHERVVAELTQLHDCVHQGLGTALALLVLLGAVGEQDTLALHVAVEDLLQA